MKSFKLGIIGRPLTHSLSPILQEYLMKINGMNGVFGKYDLQERELAGFMRKVRQGLLVGFNVTSPYKQAVVAMLDEVEPLARQINAVNTVSEKEGCLYGFNTDIVGFKNSLKKHVDDLSYYEVVILGAGGASYAVALALLQCGVTIFSIVNRTREKAESLAQKMRLIAPGSNFSVHSFAEIQKRPSQSEIIIINTTSLGAWPVVEETPLADSDIFLNAIVVDIVYNPLQTRFLKLASKKAALTIDGLDMLIFQGIAALEIWSRVSVEYEYEAIRALLSENMDSDE